MFEFKSIGGGVRAALAGLAAVIVTAAGAQASSEDADAVIAVLEDVKAAWNVEDFPRIESHWHADDPMPIYIAEEETAVMTTWPEIRAYWAGTADWNEWILIEYSDYAVKLVDEGNAVATFNLRFDVKLNDRPNPIGGDNRTVVNLRKIDGAWKIHTWVEAPLAAIVYLRKLYELNVRADATRASED
ncbi:MAG: nuclear transport factor 2 family protein [Pseudomonadota bacterium]